MDRTANTRVMSNLFIVLQKKLPRECVFRQDPEAKIFFSKVIMPKNDIENRILVFQVTFDALLENAEIINPMANDAVDIFEDFMKKPRKTF